MNTNIEEAANLSKFYRKAITDDGDEEPETRVLFADQDKNMKEPEPNYSGLANGIIRIIGYNPTEHDGLVRVLKGQDWEALVCNLEDHRIRRLYTNFIGVDPVQSITVDKRGKKDIEMAGVQKIELMHMMYHRYILRDEFKVDYIWKMEMPYRQRGWVKKLYDACKKVKLCRMHEHRDYMHRVKAELSLIRAFEYQVACKDKQRENQKGHASDKKLPNVDLPSKRQKRT